jgi:hypothetical protein
LHAAREAISGLRCEVKGHRIGRSFDLVFAQHEVTAVQASRIDCESPEPLDRPAEVVRRRHHRQAFVVGNAVAGPVKIDDRRVDLLHVFVIGGDEAFA